MCNFPSVKDAADVAIATMMSGIQVSFWLQNFISYHSRSNHDVSVYGDQVSRVELLDEVQVKAINIANGKNYPECPTLMFEFIGTGEHGYY